MKINIDDYGLHLRFAPLTLSRPVGNLRMGIYTNNERWERLLPECEVGYLTESYLQEKFPAQETSIRVNAQVIPNEEVAAAVYALEEGYSLYMNGLFIAENGNSTTKIEYVEAYLLDNKESIHGTYISTLNILGRELDFEMEGKNIIPCLKY